MGTETTVELQTLCSICKDISEQCQLLTKKAYTINHTNPIIGIIDLCRLGLTFQKVMFNSYIDILSHPKTWQQTLTNFNQQHHLLIKSILSQITSGEVENIIEPERADRRFRHPTWKTQPLYNYLKQYYLLVCQFATQVFNQLTNDNDFENNQARFHTKLLLETLAPSNFLITNPEILQLSFEQKGFNLLKGLLNYLTDLNLWHGLINIKKCELDAFTMGVNIATTKGSVIYENDLMQLIQYQPTTEKVNQIPILIVSSWVNKYYILDLREQNSFIKWVIDQGFSVFVVSWINPTNKLKNKDFADYVLEGPVTACEQMTKITGQENFHAIGFCLGGTILASTIAYFKAQGSSPIKSLTMLSSMLDFTDPGPMKHYTGDAQINLFEQSTKQHGVWHGEKMITAFNTLDSNLYIWPYFINQYLRGNSPTTLDSLFWTIDLTNIPQALFSFYMRSCLKNNSLIKPGKIKINNIGIDLTLIDIPSFIIGLEDDHISPWKTSFRTTNIIKGDKTFILVGAGHIAGALNPPNKNKYYYLQSAKINNDPNEWYQQAEKTKGSWWPKWCEWLTLQCDKTIPAINIQPSMIIEAAPGRYAKTTIHDLFANI